VCDIIEQIVIGGVVNSEEDNLRLQGDIDRLVRWAEQWQMEFNPEKYEVMNFGTRTRPGNIETRGTLGSIFNYP